MLMIYSVNTRRSWNPYEDLFELDPASNSTVIVHPGVIRRTKDGGKVDLLLHI